MSKKTNKKSDDESQTTHLKLVDVSQSELSDDVELQEKLDTALLIEALLFSVSEPLTLARIKQAMDDVEVENLPQIIDEINEKFEKQNRVYRIKKIARGYVLMTLPTYSSWIKNLLKQKTDNRLTQAALETLSIVAYRQPLTRAEVDAIRGVSSGPMLKSLIEKGLLRIAGQAEVIGRPLLYGTTQKFLDVFGLFELKDLPELSQEKTS